MARQMPKDVLMLYRKAFGDRQIATVKPIVGDLKRKRGMLANFVYDPKWKGTLPYYDIIPTSIILAVEGDRFLGINLHYVFWARRIQLANEILKRTQSKNYIKYKEIKQAWVAAKLPMALSYLCLRWYLFSHIKSEIKVFGWDKYKEIVVDLKPKFKKESEQAIYNAIMEKYRNHKKQRGK